MSHLSDLDASLAENGEDIVLRRLVGGVLKSVTVRARVRNFRLNSSDVVTGIRKVPFVVVISMTQIRAAGWPQGAPAASAAPFNVDPAIPVNGDTVVIKGNIRTVISPDPVSIGDEGVFRCNLMVEG